MSSPGELSYHHFVDKLVHKATSRFLSAQNVQKIALSFWKLMSDSFKHERKELDKRQAFWNFALSIKNAIIEKEIEQLYDLWQYFDGNGKNMWENMYENCIMHQVNRMI